jgi:hypothetical protein
MINVASSGDDEKLDSTINAYGWQTLPGDDCSFLVRVWSERRVIRGYRAVISRLFGGYNGAESGNMTVIGIVIKQQKCYQNFGAFFQK